ncbi:MAG: hypothetical protein JWP69_927 [Flaviaesturariibacter sp.]|nr:hypothetical protein [Flaviaesturariibacter sp.]
MSNKIIIGVLILVAFCILCCQQPVRKKEVNHTSDNIKNNGSRNSIFRDSNIEEDSYSFEYQGRQVDSILKKALVLADQNKTKASFQKGYEEITKDGIVQVNVDMVYGHLFNQNVKHLLIRGHSGLGTNLSIYLLKFNSFIPVLDTVIEGHDYIKDTIRDVNGDRQKDFLVHTSSGCCRRNVYNVYLYQPSSKGFASNYFFMNPTFYPAEKVIRGVEYGHSGEAPLYKYKWNEFKVDTIEYIYPNMEDTRDQTYYKTIRFRYTRPNIRKVILKKIPKEYLNVDDFDWFQAY